MHLGCPPGPQARHSCLQVLSDALDRLRVRVLYAKAPAFQQLPRAIGRLCGREEGPRRLVQQWRRRCPGRSGFRQRIDQASAVARDGIYAATRQNQSRREGESLPHQVLGLFCSNPVTTLIGLYCGGPCQVAAWLPVWWHARVCQLPGN